MKNNHTIEVSIDLLEYLKEVLRESPGEKPEERWTRLEAYCDLVDKAEIGFVCKSVKSNRASLQHNQFQTTVSELAEEWHWHRATVRSFLENLERFGQIRQEKLSKSVLVTMLQMKDDATQTDSAI